MYIPVQVPKGCCGTRMYSPGRICPQSSCCRIPENGRLDPTQQERHVCNYKFGFSFNMVQNAIRLSTSDVRHVLCLTGYPFDTNENPAYELINLAQISAYVIRRVYRFKLHIM